MEKTIAAISTAYGEGGIGIVRISGPEALGILEQIFLPSSMTYNDSQGGTDQREYLTKSTGMTIGSPIVNKRLTYGKILDPQTGHTLDEVLCVYMKGPYTYTAEDVVEINCHGSVVSLRKVLSLVLRQGAELAEPGEFTKRAFLNGRLDLSQAEAVIDLIRAKTDKGFDVAMNQLSGGLSCEIQKIRDDVLDLLVNLAVNIDYPDEDIEELTYETLEKSLLAIGDNIEKLRLTADTGRIVTEGLNVVIAGKPNVGKSSLMNALLRETRAIVTEIPGTTRDTIEEVISIQNIPVRLTDTAGIRQTEDVIERMGIEKSKAHFNKADLILLVLDGSQTLSMDDREIIEAIGEKSAMVLINKSDLDPVLSEKELCSILPGGKADILYTAVTKGEGLEQIEEKIVELVYGGRVSQKESVLITNARHTNLLEKAARSISDGLAMAQAREALDFIQLDVNSCYEYLGEMIGETVSEDIINQVFARFCLGK